MGERLEYQTIRTETVTAPLDIHPHTVLVGVAVMQQDLMHRRQLLNRVDRAGTETTMTMTIIEFAVSGSISEVDG
jgi:hypothetical protein